MSVMPIILLGAVSALTAGPSAAPSAARDPSLPLVGNWPADRAVWRPVSLRSIKLGGFLGQHVEANNRLSIPAGLNTVLPKAIEARAHGQEPPPECNRLATDSDFYKWLEGASYAVAYDPALTDLAAAVDRYADLIARLQEPGGYLGTRLSPARPFDERVLHDLYVAGHLFEAAVAHFEATGGRKLLATAQRLADFYLDAFQANHRYFKQIGQEHPEIELALVRLARATGEKRFLDFSAALTQRAVWGPRLADIRAGASKRHAVRLCYQLGGAADLYLQTGAEGFYPFLPPLWDELVTTRMYMTGGIGANEVVPEEPYDLPQNLPNKLNRDIAETCASVALMMFSWRMHAITGDSGKFDAIETILYNHYLGAVSSDHLGIFYYNPLKRIGDLTGRTDHGGNPVARTRLPDIHATACCMPNAWRFFAQLPEYVLSVRRDGLGVNLYTDAKAERALPDGTVLKLEMQTKYPHEGEVRLKLTPEQPARLAVYLRIPGWCEGATVGVNGDAATAAPAGTYHRIEREWRPGDRVVLNLPMKPAIMVSPPQVQANRGQVAFRRGPLVYCLEKQDAGGINLEDVVVVLDRADPTRSLADEFDPQLGMHRIKVPVAGKQPDAPAEPGNVRLIPFYFRANRAADTRWITLIPVQ